MDRRLRAARGFAGLPVIAMTAHVMMEEQERCLALGMRGHIGKPIDPDELYRVVSSFCRRPASFQSTGRTNRWNVSMQATGLPGRPKKCVGPMRPTAIGRPGCLATCQKSMPPASSRTALTRS